MVFQYLFVILWCKMSVTTHRVLTSPQAIRQEEELDIFGTKGMDRLCTFDTYLMSSRLTSY